jgi:hypothetical protein
MCINYDIYCIQNVCKYISVRMTGEHWIPSTYYQINCLKYYVYYFQLLNVKDKKKKNCTQKPKL